MFSKDSCQFVCELGLMLSGTMFEMGFTAYIMLYGLVTSTLFGVLLREGMNMSSRILCSSR